MKVENFHEKIRAYSEANPEISPEEIGVLLHIDKLYEIDMSELVKFRGLYAHLDPNIAMHESEGIIFLKIAASDEPSSVIKHRLNSYMNIKYHYLGNYKSYAENMKLFAEHCGIVTGMIDEILELSKMPKPIREILSESAEVRETKDLYDLLKLYRKTESKRVRFEILRRIGLIVLVSRINRSFIYEDTDIALKEVRNVFHKGLGLKRHEKKHYYFWVDEHDKVVFTKSSRNAKALYHLSNLKRKRLALKEHPLQSFEYTPLSTKFGSSIIHMESRNKLRQGGKACYTSKDSPVNGTSSTVFRPMSDS